MSTNVTPINVTTQKVTIAALLTALVNGIHAELAGVDPVVVDGTQYARVDLLARIQAGLDAIAVVRTARTGLIQAVTSQKAAVAQAKTVRAGMKRYLQTKYGPTSPKLQEFGFTPARAAKPTVKTKAEAKVKAAATRQARGTKGKKQKLAIKAAPPGVSTTPTGAVPPTGLVTTEPATATGPATTGGTAPKS
jgi:hypothetical protein